jgi:hypothetical protein
VRKKSDKIGTNPKLHHLHGVDVDFEIDRGGRLDAVSEHFDKALQARKAAGAEYELIAVIVRDDGEGALGRAEHVDIRKRGFLGDAAGGGRAQKGLFPRMLKEARAEHHAAEARRGGKFELPTGFELAIEEA